MAFTVQIPTAFACPNDDIFSLPTKEDLTNAINKIAQVPSKLRVAIVEMGAEIAEDVKKEIEDIIKTIEDFIETISEILSPYWKKGQIRNWQKEANDAITEFIQEFHIYIPTKVAELIAKIVPISLTIPVFGLSIDCLRLMDKAYQQELQDQIAGITPDFTKSLEQLKKDLEDGKLTAEEYRVKMQELIDGKGKILDKFFKLIPANMRGWEAELGVKCDEWKAKMTWQYIKTEIQKLLTGNLFAVFDKLIGKFKEIWDALGLPSLPGLLTMPDVGALIDLAIKSFTDKRKKLFEKLQDPELGAKAKQALLDELESVSKSITDAIENISIFGFNISAIIGGKIDTTVNSLEEKVIEMKLAFKDFCENWQKKLLFDWVKIVKKFFSAIGLGAIFKPIMFTFCDFLGLIGFPPTIPTIGAIAGVMDVSLKEPKQNTYVADSGDDSGVFHTVTDGIEDTFQLTTGDGDFKVFVDGEEKESGVLGIGEFIVSNITGGKKIVFHNPPTENQDISLIFV